MSDCAAGSSDAPASHGPTSGDHLPRRLRRERRTVEIMVEMYCRAHHDSGAGAAGVTAHVGADLCPECAELLDYTVCRIATCRFGPEKPTCARCTVHCFRASEREDIRQVMRYAGPRMALRHPYLAVRHLLDRHHTPASV